MCVCVRVRVRVRVHGLYVCLRACVLSRLVSVDLCVYVRVCVCVCVEGDWGLRFRDSGLGFGANGLASFSTCVYVRARAEE